VHTENFQYQLERLDLGIVWIDVDNHVTGFNDIAWQLLAPAGEQTLGIPREQLIGIDLLKMHPLKSRDKLALLLNADNAPGIAQCPITSPPAITMMINIPDRVLLLKVSKIIGAEGVIGGCMVYYDLTDITTSRSLPSPANESSQPQQSLRQLRKIPVYRANRLMLIEVEDALRLESNDHYTWIVTAIDRYLSNLSLSDLADRLDPSMFFRCHRSHIVNLNHVKEIDREGNSVHLVFANPTLTRIPVSRNHVGELREIFGY
jgi:LytTR family transcriptional regulator, CO-responsive transcriptional regulator RcoM